MGIKDKKQELENERSEINDVVKATGEIAELVQRTVTSGFQAANQSDSIDGRIQGLIQTLQSVANAAIEYHNDKEKAINEIDIKLGVLNELLSEELEESNDDIMDSVQETIETMFSQDTVGLEDDEKKE
jgi:predicted transcriptional regulator